MTNLLTAAQAANALRVAVDDPRMLDLLPQIDRFVQDATGRDWAQDATIHPVAVSAATLLLVKWFEDPGALGASESLSFGLQAALSQLEAEALKYRTYQFYGLRGAGNVAVPGFQIGDQVIKLVGIYGVSGDQSAAFGTEVTLNGVLPQLSAADLSQNLYAVVLKSPIDDVVP